jgi:hypothetical protein
MEGFDIEFKSLKAGAKAIQRSQKELLPVEIEPELEDFFHERGFKREKMPDHIRANIQISMRRALGEKDLNFIIGYSKGGLMVWVFDGFCTVGGRVTLDDRPENAEFFNLLAENYHVFMWKEKISAFMDRRRAEDVLELKELCEQNLKLVNMQNTSYLENLIRDVEEERGKPAGGGVMIMEPPSGLAKTVYTPDEATKKFFEANSIEYLTPESFSSLRRYFEFTIRTIFENKDIQPISFYYHKDKKIWVVRAQDDWKVYCQLISDEAKEETESRYGLVLEPEFISGGAEFTMKFYPVGSAKTLAELRALYEDAERWQDKWLS